MNQLLMTTAIATGFLFLETADLRAQPRPNPNLARQNFSRPVPPVRGTTFSPYYVYPKIGPQTPYNPYAYYMNNVYIPNLPAVTNPSYNTYSYPAYNPYAYQSYYQGYNPYYNPGYYPNGFYYGGY